MEAKKRQERLKQLYKNVNEKLDELITIDMNFTDFKAFDFQVEIGKWKQLPDEVAKDVRTMGVCNRTDKIIILTTYGAGSYIAPHFHSDAFEMVKILYGKFEERTSGRVLVKGDVMVFDPHQNHYITSDKGGVLLICFSKTKGSLNYKH